MTHTNWHNISSCQENKHRSDSGVSHSNGPQYEHNYLSYVTAVCKVDDRAL